MNIYERLGIQKEASIEEIRHAYQKKLKEIDMLRDLVGYQALRAAYNQALRNVHQLEINGSTNSQAAPTKQIKETTIPTIKEEPIPLKVEQPKTVKKSTTLKEPKEETSTPSKLTASPTFSEFLAEKNYYSDYSLWNKFLTHFSPVSEQEKKALHQEIQSFLMSNYALLSDSVRFNLIEYIDLRSNDFSAEEDKKLFSQKVTQNNFLDFDFFNYIPKDNRDHYFKQRYHLYETIQKKDELVPMPVNVINQMKLTNYQDDDLNYLLSVYSLVFPPLLTTQEMRERLEDIKGDKYQHDITVYQKMLDLLDNPSVPVISNVDIIGLTWVTDTVKENLMTRVKAIRRTQTHHDAINNKKTVSPKRKKTTTSQENKFSWLKYLGIGIVVITLGINFLSDSPSDNPFDDFDTGVYDIEDEEDYNEFQEVDYKLEERQSNVKLNWDMYYFLFYNEDFDEDFVNISLDTQIAMTEFREAHQAELETIGSEDWLTGIKETHYLTDEQTVTTYVTFEDSDFFNLEIVTDNTNQIIQFKSVDKQTIPDTLSLGNLDAALFFSADTTLYYDDKEGYLTDLSELYPDYMTEELYQKIVDLDEQAFSRLSEFNTSRPYLLEGDDIQSPVLLLTNYDEDHLFLVLDENNQLSEFYDTAMDEIPEEYQSALEKIDIDWETIMENPWLYELGVDYY